jgi:hypothetical protein
VNAVVLAAFAGLLGLIIGRLWDTHAEAASWKRDQRIRIYENLADSYYQVREALRALAISEPGTTESEAIETRVYEIAASGWNQHVVAGWLHGSPQVISTIENLDRHVVQLFLLARGRRFTWDEFQEARKPVQEALEHYVEAVRRELRQPALKVTVSYSFHGLPESRKAADIASSPENSR